MKFSTTHFEGLKSEIEKSGIDLIQTKKNYEEKGLSETRYVWDIFWAVSFHKFPNFREASYKDAHIETAIKKAINEILTK
tara:strand:+ start:43 stop:282 length:240 start_codon:yes stop_codon:yes gene_type:complete